MNPIDEAIRRLTERVRTLEVWTARIRGTNELGGVPIVGTPDDGDVLVFNDYVATWEPGIAVLAVDDLTDVNAPAPDSGDALTFDGAEWTAVHALTAADVIGLITPDITYCDSLTVISSRGSIGAGAHTDLHAVGGTLVRIDETATTPGIEVEAAFSGLDDLSDIYVSGYYDGNHTVTVQLYNYDTTTWTTVLTFATGGTEVVAMHAQLADGLPYVDGGGNAKARFYHAAAGNPTHDLYLDYLAVSHVPGGGGGAIALDDLSDVNAPAPADGEVLAWDGGANEWVNTAAGVGRTFPFFVGG